jgi:INO80 complex subunit C
MSQPTEAQIAHQKLIDQLDIHSIHRRFRNPHWRPNQRRNKNIKTIIGDASRKEASMAATPQANSGAATPMQLDDNGLSTSGTSTPAHPANGNGDNNSSSLQPNLAQASRSLSKLVLEKTLRPNASGATTTSAPSVTYTNVESAPSLAHTKRYCDVTGLPAPYVDPKSRLRYHNKEVFSFIRSMAQGTPEAYLEARGAHTILK